MKTNKPKMILKIRPRQTILPKKVFVASAFLIILFIVAIIFYFQFGNIENIRAATTGDYRSIGSGNWSNTLIWERYNGTSWASTVTAPSSAESVITIQSGHTITVSVNATADQVVVNTGGALTISAGKTLTIANGTGDDLTINGTMTITGTLANQGNTAMTIAGNVTLQSGGNHTFGGGAICTINNGGRYKRQDTNMGTGANIWTVNSGGVFQQDINGDNIPLATWNLNSTCEETGVTTTKPGNLDQSFYNFTWNCANQTSIENLTGKLTSISGDFNFINSGTGIVDFCHGENYTMNVGGNFNVQAGSLFACTKSTSCIINITGNYVQTGGLFGGSDISNAGDHAKGTPTINVTGNFSISAGTLDMTEYDNNSNGEGITTLNLSGNFTQTGGTITETATTTATYGNGKIYFAKVGTEFFSKTGGTISNTIHFTVNSGAILDMGTSYPTGNGTFTLASGGGLNMGSLDGITQTSSNGNVQVTGTRSYSTGADYTYNGSGNQNSGDGLPATVHNLTVNNGNKLIPGNTVAVTNLLTLTSGIIQTSGTVEVNVTNSSASSVAGYSSTSYVNGRLRRTISATGSYDFPVGTNNNYELITCSPVALTGVSNVLAEFFNGSCGNVPPGLFNNGRAIRRTLNHGYWSLDPNATPTGGTYGVTIYAKGMSGELSTDPLDYAVLHRNDASSNWGLDGTDNSSAHAIIGSLSTGQIKSGRTGFTSFSHYTGGSAGGMLPIQLIYFHAKLNDDKVDLSWLTGSEINNEYFTIERSADGRNYEEVFRKPGAGNSTEPLHYSGTDVKPLTGYSYYRLKQTDFDGRFTYSEMQTIKNKSGPGSESSIEIASVGPNPFSNRFKISFTTKASESKVEFQLINSSGQLVHQDVINTNDGMNEYEFEDQKGLPPGIYFVNLVYGNEKVTQKLIKKE